MTVSGYDSRDQQFSFQTLLSTNPDIFLSKFTCFNKQESTSTAFSLVRLHSSAQVGHTGVCKTIIQILWSPSPPIETRVNSKWAMFYFRNKMLNLQLPTSSKAERTSCLVCHKRLWLPKLLSSRMTSPICNSVLFSSPPGMKCPAPLSNQNLLYQGRTMFFSALEKPSMSCKDKMIGLICTTAWEENEITGIKGKFKFSPGKKN